MPCFHRKPQVIEKSVQELELLFPFIFGGRDGEELQSQMFTLPDERVKQETVKPPGELVGSFLLVDVPLLCFLEILHRLNPTVEADLPGGQRVLRMAETGDALLESSVEVLETASRRQIQQWIHVHAQTCQ